MTPSGRARAQPVSGAEGATSPEPLRQPGPDGTSSSGVLRPRRRGNRGGASCSDPGLQELAVTFASRHIGPDQADQQRMLDAIGYASLDELSSAALPAGLATEKPLNLPAALEEDQVLAEL